MKLLNNVLSKFNFLVIILLSIPIAALSAELDEKLDEIQIQKYDYYYNNNQCDRIFIDLRRKINDKFLESMANVSRFLVLGGFKIKPFMQSKTDNEAFIFSVFFSYRGKFSEDEQHYIEGAFTENMDKREKIALRKCLISSGKECYEGAFNRKYKYDYREYMKYAKKKILKRDSMGVCQR